MRILVTLESGSPIGNRTQLPAVKEQYPEPLDDRTKLLSAALLVFLTASASAGIVTTNYWDNGCRFTYNLNTVGREVQTFDGWMFMVCNLPKQLSKLRISIF